jgi:hypothetical protein
LYSLLSPYYIKVFTVSGQMAVKGGLKEGQCERPREPKNYEGVRLLLEQKVGGDVEIVWLRFGSGVF